MTRVYALRDSVRHAVSTIRRGARPPFLNTITHREREREREREEVDAYATEVR